MLTIYDVFDDVLDSCISFLETLRCHENLNREQFDSLKFYISFVYYMVESGYLGSDKK